MSDEQELHETEPDDYMLVRPANFRTHVLGDTEREVGFCVNSPGAAGYCDDESIWVADQLVDPVRVIEVCIHECLHGIFPELTEDQVEQAALHKVFQCKGVGPLPQLAPLLTEDNVGTLFPGAASAPEAKP